MAGSKTKNSKKTLVIVLCIVLGVLILACAGVGIWYFTRVTDAAFTEEDQALYDEIQGVINDGVFIKGIKVDGVEIGGMTMAEAKQAVNEAHKEQLDSLEYTFKIDDETVVLKQSNSFAVRYNLTEVLNQAFTCVDYSNPDVRTVMEQYSAIKENGKEYTCTAEIDENSLRTKLDIISSKYTQEAKDATYKINMDAPEGKKVEFVDGQSGVTIDTEKMYDTIVELFAKGEGGALEVATQVVEPTVTKEQLEAKYTLRASAVTSYNDASHGYATRVHNIEKATKLVSGTVLTPGQVFSMNDTIGDRTYANGWKEGGALVNGSTETQAGGGVCQVASTLYNAVVKADIEIVYRRNHSEQLSYVGGGLDATINTGTIDFKFKNNTNSDLLIIGYNINKHVYFEVYGEPFGEEYDHITLTSKMLGVVSPSGETEYKVVKGKPASYTETKVRRKNGSKWISYKNYWKGEKLVKTETLAESTYRAFNGLILVGEGSEHDPDATPTPSATTSAKPTKTAKPAKTEKPTKTAKPTKTTAPTKTAGPAPSASTEGE